MWYGKAFVITIRLKEIDLLLNYINFEEDDVFLGNAFEENENGKKEVSRSDINMKALIRGVFLRFWFN